MSIPVLISADYWSVSPAFDEHVSGATNLVNMQSFAMESKLKIRAAGGDGVPAGVEYIVSIAPINGTDAAIGTVRTDFRDCCRNHLGRAGVDAPRSAPAEKTDACESAEKR